MSFWAIYLVAMILLCGRYDWQIIGRWVDAKKVNNIRFAAGIVLITVVAAIRYNVGYDWANYLQIMYGLRVGIMDFRDVIPTALLWLSQRLGFPIIFFGTCAAVTYGSAGYCFKKYSSDTYESLMIYFCLLYVNSLSITRQAAAAAVLLCGYRFIREKKLVPYILVCLLAAMFHKYALVGVLIYFIYYMPLPLFAGIMVCGTAVIEMGLQLISGITDYEAGSTLWYLVGVANVSGTFTSLIYVIVCVYAVFLVLFRRRYDQSADDDTMGLLKICITGAALPFVLGTHTGGRVAEFFIIYFTLLLPRLHEAFSPIYRKAFICIFYAYMLIYISYTAKTGADASNYIPFATYFHYGWRI